MVRWRRFPTAVVLSIVGLLLAGATAASAVTLEPIGTYASPVYVTSDPTDEDRIFVVEQDGRIQLTVGGTTTQFVDLDPVVVSAQDGGGNEQGLLSMAFAPDFRTSGRFYVFYTGTDSGNLHVGELTASGDSVDPATLRDVITIAHGASQFHNGGQLQLGPDGYLYVSTGDGGTGGGLAQDPGSLLGKILRIAPIPGGGHTVPGDNPLGNEVWSLGLRNPWRFTFDRATGDMVIADVGQSAFEEVDDSPAPVAGRGLNFGWPCREGFAPGPGGGCAGPLTDPVFAYANDAGTCAITGGYVIRDPGLTELQGRYVYADLCAGVIRSFAPDDPFGSDRSEGVSVTQPTSFGQDACGRIYIAARTGPVSRLVDDSPTDCPLIDLTGPGLALDGKHKQNIARHRWIKVKAGTDESGSVTVGGQVTAGKHDKDLFELDAETAAAQAGESKDLHLKLRRKQAARCRRLVEDGKRVEVHLGGFAIDAAGNRGPDASLEIRLTVD